MAGIGGTIYNMVFKKVLSGSTVINTPKEFDEFANTVSTISCSYLSNNDLLQEPDRAKESTPIPDIIKTHKIVRVYTSKGVPFFACSHNENEVDGNTFCHCLKC